MDRDGLDDIDDEYQIDDEYEIDDEYDDPHAEIVPSSRVDQFRRGSLAGAVLNGIALGLREVLEVEKEQAPIVQDASGDPPTPKHVDAELDPDDPAASTVTVRPWLAPGANE